MQFAPVGLTVNPAALTITASDQTKTYGTTLALGTTAFTETGLVNSDTVSGVTLTSAGAAATATVTGSPYAITPSAAVGTGLGNYTITYVNAPAGLTVTPAALTITASDQTKTYGTTLALGTTAFTETGLVNSDTVTGVTLVSAGAAATATVAGSPYAITPSVAVGTGLGNYTITYVNAPVGLTVSPAALTITAAAQTKTYGTTLALGTTAFTDTGLVNSDTVTGVTLTSAGAAATASVVGSPYTITPSAAAGTGLGNYNITYVNAPAGLTVTPAALTITASDQTKTYGTTLALGTTAFTETGLVNSDAVTGVTLASAGAAATATVAGSPYTITPSAAVGTGLGNYTVTYVNAPVGLAVTPAALTVTATDQTKTYGTALDLGTTGFTDAGLLNGDTVTGVTLTSAGAAATATVAGSPYAITPSAAVGTGLGNYTIAYVNAPAGLTVNPATLTITASDQTKTYGTALSLGTTAFTDAGLLNSDTVTGVTLASTGAAATANVAGSPYAIMSSAAVGTGLGNYTITYQSGALAVSQKALTYSVADVQSFFGILATLGAATLNGIVPGDTVTPTVEAFSGGTPVVLSATTPVGIYDQLVTALSNPNYTIAVAGNKPGILMIGMPSIPGSNPAIYAPGGPISNASIETWPPFVNSCSAGPDLPNPNHYSDPLAALEAMSRAMTAFCERCNDPTQSNIADALERFAQELAVLAPRLPPQLRNLPTIVHEAAEKVRSARTVAEAVGALATAINQVNHDIALLRVSDPDAAAANAGLGRLVNATLQASEQRLIRVSGL